MNSKDKVDDALARATDTKACCVRSGALDATPELVGRWFPGAKESLVHCYDYLLSDDPGRTAFGEKAGSPRKCREAFERAAPELRRLADFVSGAERGSFSMGADGVSAHEFTKGGRRFVARLNTKDEPVAGLPPHGFELKECKRE